MARNFSILKEFVEWRETKIFSTESLGVAVEACESSGFVELNLLISLTFLLSYS